MTSNTRFLKKSIPAALGALTLGALYAGPAGALELDFKQNSGFYSGNNTATPCTLADICVASLIGLGNIPAGGAAGGFDFFNLVPPPSEVPPANSFPAYRQAAWGCASGGVNCANFSNGFVPTWTAPNGWDIDPYAFVNPAPLPLLRSSLEVEGQFGDGSAGHPKLNDLDWTTITIVTHNNNDIDGNVLNTIDIVSWLELGSPLSLPQGTAPNVVHVDFQETSNHPAAETDAGCKAVADNRPDTNFALVQPPINPLGSVCDDFAVIARSDLIPQPVPLPGFQLAFRLLSDNNQFALVCDGTSGQPVECAGYDGTDIVIYTSEHHSNVLKIQAKLVPDTVGGCTFTQGYWKTHSQFGPAKKPDAGWFLIGDEDGDTVSEGPNELFFSSGQTWYQTFWTNPKGGNAYYILAHQYEAAVLNIANGASSVSLGPTLSDAAALLASSSAAKDIPKNSPDRAIAISLAGILNSFNQGTLPGGPLHCAEQNPEGLI